MVTRYKIFEAMVIDPLETDWFSVTDPDVAKMLLDNGQDVNATRNGSTLLMNILNTLTGKHSRGVVIVDDQLYVDTVELLILHGADVNEPNLFGLTPLMTCAVNLRVDVFRKLFKILVKAGADITARHKGTSVLDFLKILDARKMYGLSIFDDELQEIVILYQSYNIAELAIS